MVNSLREQRKVKGLTQIELGQLAKVPQQNLSAMERGKMKPSPATKERIELIVGKCDWISNSRIRLKGNYTEAERLVKKLLSVTVGMDEPDKTEITKLIRKCFK